MAGCSSVPDEVNPVEWYRGASAWVTGDDADATARLPSTIQEPASEDVPFPNLASVPERPEPTPDPGVTEAMIASLEQDRSEAQAADARLRAAPIEQGARQAAALPPPATADAGGSSERFPPLELPPVGSALGDTDTIRTGRFSDVEREREGPAPARQAGMPAPRSAPAASPAPSAGPRQPARELASARDVSPRPPIQPPEPMSTGRRSFASTMPGQGAAPASPARAASVTPRPPIQPPQPYSAPRSSVSREVPGAASLAALAR